MRRPQRTPDEPLIHLRRKANPKLTVCGLEAAGPIVHAGPGSRRLVTCTPCLKQQSLLTLKQTELPLERKAVR
jgi:hypothetical protein